MMISLECTEAPEKHKEVLEVGKVYIATGDYSWSGSEYFKILIGDKTYLFLKCWFKVID